MTVDGLEPLGRSLIVLGIALAAIGALFVVGPRIPILGHLPGDFVFRRDDVTIYVPLTSMVVVSVIVSVVIGLLGRR